MTDRELLELAAKAAGIEGEWGNEKYIERYEGFIPTGWLRAWNPLNNDAEAFRLAVKLEMNIAHRTVDVDVSIGSVSASEYVPTYKDRKEATRRAIVRAAAEIGKEMK